MLVIGDFNIFHPGHLRLLKFAKDIGDFLIVAVKSDRIAGSAAHVPELLRLESIKNIGLVDKAFITDEAPDNLILKLRPNIVVKGKEYEEKFNIELDALNKHGGKLIFCSGENNFSSLELIRREFELIKSNSIGLPSQYMTRHDISLKKTKEILDSFSALNVCVIGDLIIDRYLNCQPLGMSQEDPTIVVTPIEDVMYLGGAGIVASHAASLGSNSTFISVMGDDEAGKFAVDKLVESGVHTHMMMDRTRPTTLKERYRSKGKSLLKVSYLHQTEISLELQKSIIDYFNSIVPKINLLVFSDFNYGCLPQTLVNELIRIAQMHGAMIVADSQSSSQSGDISRFKGMDLITPTEYEARLSSRNFQDGLVVMAESLQKISCCKNILLKLGEEGLLVQTSKDKTGWQTDRVNALNASPKDTAGAGDSLLIASAMAMASGGTIWEAAFLGSIAAAIQVGREGNIPITINEIMQIFAQ